MSRWTPKEAELTRDGIDVRTLDFSAPERLALEVVARPTVVATLGQFGGGGALGKHDSRVDRLRLGGRAVAGWRLLAERYFQGGRALQRVWLTGTPVLTTSHRPDSIF